MIVEAVFSISKRDFRLLIEVNHTDWQEMCVEGGKKNHYLLQNESKQSKTWFPLLSFRKTATAYETRRGIVLDLHLVT